MQIVCVYPRVYHGFGIKQAYLRLGVNLPQLHQNVMVEGGIDYPALHTHFALQLYNLIPNAVVYNHVALYFNVYGKVRVLQQPVNFFKRRDAHVLIARHAV